MKKIPLPALILTATLLAFVLGGLGFIFHKKAYWILDYVAAYWVYILTVIAILYFPVLGGISAIKKALQKK